MGSITLVGGIVMLRYTHQIDSTLHELVRKELVLYQIAGDMELALANQKGFLTYYLVDGDGKWLESLGKYRQVFQQSLDQAYKLEPSGRQKETLDRIATKYKSYIEAKDVVVENYKKTAVGVQPSISYLHEQQRDVFFQLLERCRAFSFDQWKSLVETENITIQRSSKLRATVYVAIILFMSLCGLFLFVLYKHILGPIRGLAIETGSSPKESTKDEVVSLSQSLKGMMKDFDETHDELAKSRKHLLQAERMAMVGELAAGVAHTIRNPFTSIKMRMFSLTRTLDLADSQHEDLKVISDEIGRIDNIVQNFLEFARPPKLKLEECRVSDLIQSVIILMEYRLKEYDAELRYISQPDLPRIMVDADRLKEALVNLITNSCEAMGHGGIIEITEQLESDPEMGHIAVITLRDNGPGIPESIRYKVMAPFFTTKEEGSGLGLSIVNRIVKEHRGKLLLSPSSGKNAEFIIKLPVRGYIHEPDTHN